MSVALRRLVALGGAVAACAALPACGEDEAPPSADRARTPTPAPAEPRPAPAPAPSQEGGVGALGLGDEHPGSTGIRPFAADSPWNTSVETVPVDRRSATWIAQARERVGVVEAPGDEPRTERRVITEGLYVNRDRFTTPIVDGTGGVPTRVVCRQLPPSCGDGADLRSLTMPPDVDPLPQYDGWLTVLDRDAGVAYDLWRARRARDAPTLSYQFLRRWELDGPGFQAPGSVSARGSGLPLFAGVILPEEIRAGRIDHALAIALPGLAQRTYVRPASATDGSGRPTSIPAGARIRLKPAVQLTFRPCPADHQARVERAQRTPTPDDDRAIPRCFPSRTNRHAARTIVRALKRYGAIVVDRSSVPSMYAKRNADWDGLLRDDGGRLLDGDLRPLPARLQRLPGQGTPLLRGNEVQQLRIEDFEVVATSGPLLRFPPLAGTPGAGARDGATATATAPGTAPPPTSPTAP